MWDSSMVTCLCNLDLVGNPEDRFSHNETRMIFLNSAQNIVGTR